MILVSPSLHPRTSSIGRQHNNDEDDLRAWNQVSHGEQTTCTERYSLSQPDRAQAPATPTLAMLAKPWQGQPTLTSSNLGHQYPATLLPASSKPCFPMNASQPWPANFGHPNVMPTNLGRPGQPWPAANLSHQPTLAGRQPWPAANLGQLPT